MSKKSILSESNYKDFYNRALQFFLTPCEQIKDILKQAKTKVQDEKLIESIGWAIKTLNETDMFDFSLKTDFLSQADLHTDKYVKFLSEYSYKMLMEKAQETSECQRRRAMLSHRLPTSTNLLFQHNDLLKSINSIDFDIFSFKQVIGDSKLLYTVSNYIFEEWDLFYIISEEKFSSFIKAVNHGYKQNPYHNVVHATDVLQTVMIIMKQGNFIKKKILEPIDIAAVFVSSILHDIKHPGLSNQYHINKRSPLAFKYNDKSPLENMHCYEGFKILFASETNILEDLSKEELNVFRQRMIDAILSTDGANHSKVFNPIKEGIDRLIKENGSNSLSNFLQKLVESDDQKVKFNKQQDLINYIVHSSDISNPGKNFENIYSKWTELVMTEFFSEGDLEKKEHLPVHFLCDRNTTVIPKAQINFIRFLTMPTFKLLTQVIPSIKRYEDNMVRNIRKWEKQLEQESNESKC